jgi:hypothetical protein
MNKESKITILTKRAAFIAGFIAMATCFTPAISLAQGMAEATVEILKASDNTPMSAAEKITVSVPAVRNCAAKKKKNVYVFEGSAKPNKFLMRFKADTRSTICAERFPLISRYVVTDKAKKKGKNKTELIFRGELVPSGVDGIYEGLMIQQMGKAKRDPEFILKILNFRMTDVK